MLNGFGYTLFTIPSRDLETTWRDVSELSVQQSMPSSDIDQVSAESALVSKEISTRRFAKSRLYTGGRILHIVRRKKTEMEKWVEYWFSNKKNIGTKLFTIFLMILYLFLEKPKPEDQLMKCDGVKRKNFRNSESCQEWFSTIYQTMSLNVSQPSLRNKKPKNTQKSRSKVSD